MGYGYEKFEKSPLNFVSGITQSFFVSWTVKKYNLTELSKSEMKENMNIVLQVCLEAWDLICF